MTVVTEMAECEPVRPGPEHANRIREEVVLSTTRLQRQLLDAVDKLQSSVFNVNNYYYNDKIFVLLLLLYFLSQRQCVSDKPLVPFSQSPFNEGVSNL